MVFDYSRLPPPPKRRFVPEGLSFDWSEIEKQFASLRSRDLGSVNDLQAWLNDEDELDAVIYERKALLSFNYTRETDNKERREAYEAFTADIEPKVKVATFELYQKFVGSPHRKSLPEVDALEGRRRETAISIFRAENVDLERQDAELEQEHQRVVGAMTVDFQGKERTMQQMSKFLEETDRKVREDAWRRSTDRFLRDSGALDGLYDKMVSLRERIAKNAGFENYRDFVFPAKYRFDYTPEDCFEFHRAVEEHFVPISRELDEDRARRLGLDRLEPWDLRVDPEGRPPLTPFVDEASLARGCLKALRSLDPGLSKYFERMYDLGLLDLTSRKGKAPGGYQDVLAEHRLPFIFMNAAGRDQDMRTLLHESGHSAHTFLMNEAGLPNYNSNGNLPLEFAEVASTSMELLGGYHIEGAFYSRDDARRSNREALADIAKLFTWVATIDSFQHWVYTHPAHSREERAKAWAETFRRFSGLEDYGDHEDALRFRWQRQQHLFGAPFYYIEYGIALVGALGVWLRYKEDRGSALNGYKQALSLGATKPLPELFAAAGLEWDFGPRSLGRLARELRSAVKEYSE